jgi:hypothetical protein
VRRHWVWLMGIAIVGTLMGLWATTPTLNNLGNIDKAKVVMLTSSDEAERANQAARAVALYQLAYHYSPASPDAWLRIAEVYIAEEVWAKAYESYDEFRTSGGDTLQALARLRGLASFRDWCGLNSNQVEAAAWHLADQATAYRIVGDICAGSNRNAAIDAYKRALNLAANSDLAIAAARLLVQRAEDLKGTSPSEALADYAEIVQLLERFPPAGPQAAQGYYYLAWSSWQLNQFDQAIAAYQSCVAEEPATNHDRFVCALHLGYIYSTWLPEARRDLKKAQSYYQQAEQLAANEAERTEVAGALGRLAGQ